MDQTIHDGHMELRGGGHWPVRVEVSGDGGSVWYQVPYDKMNTNYFYTRRLWEIDTHVDTEVWLEFCVRTWDNALNTQPTFVRTAWYAIQNCTRPKCCDADKRFT